MKSRFKQVQSAIHFEQPDYVPLLFFNGDKEQSDLVMIDVVRHFMGAKADQSEWGFQWERLDQTMGQPKREIISDWLDDFPKLEIPRADDISRFEKVTAIKKRYGERYYLASLVLSGFTVMSFLRGLVNVFEDFYDHPREIERLADIVFGFEEGIIRQLPDYGFHGVAFFDDWGTQSNLLISPKLWRDFFKPRYQRQFELAHRHHLDVYFHSCGYIYEIIPDLIESGVDMLNLSQPNIFDIERIGKEFGGKVCFVCPISYQTTALSGTKEDIYREAKRLIDCFGSAGGGFIGYLEEYPSIGMSPENYQHCIDAFRHFGAGLL